MIWLVLYVYCMCVCVNVCPLWFVVSSLVPLAVLSRVCAPFPPTLQEIWMAIGGTMRLGIAARPPQCLW